MKEKKIENCLMDIISELDEVEGIDNFGTEINDIESFEEAGILTKDKGVILYLDDGTTVELTIQAYKNGMRCE